MSNPCRGIMRMRKGAHGDEDSPEGCHAGYLPARSPPRVYPRGDLGWDGYWSPGGRTRQPSQTTTLSGERSLGPGWATRKRTSRDSRLRAFRISYSSTRTASASAMRGRWPGRGPMRRGKYFPPNDGLTSASVRLASR